MKKFIVVLIGISIFALTPQPAQGQKWLQKIGKALNKVDQVLGGNNSSSSSNKSSKKSSSSSQKVPQSNSNSINSDNVATIHETANTKVYNIDGNVIFLEPFSNGLACVKTTKGQWFVINKQGEKVFDIPYGFRPKGVTNAHQSETLETGTAGNYRAGYDSNRLMAYSEETHKAIIYDNTGKVVKTFNDVENATGFLDGVAVIEKEEQKPGKWLKQTVYYHIDINGNTLSSTMDVNSSEDGGLMLYPLYNGLSPVCHSGEYKAKDTYGFRNAKCQWAIKPIFTFVQSFRGDGLASAKDPSTGKWGFIDTLGNWVIQPIYSNRTGSFHCGLARVTDKSNNVYFIDKTGKIVFADQGKNCEPFMDKTGFAMWNENGTYWLVNTSFKKCMRLPSTIETYNETLFVVREGDNNVAYDWNGKALLKWPYNAFGYYDFNTLISDGIGANIPFSKQLHYGDFLSDNNVYYYFNLQGEIIAEFKNTQF